LKNKLVEQHQKLRTIINDDNFISIYNNLKSPHLELYEDDYQRLNEPSKEI
ncbi:MAG: hypothetical protein HRT87_10375, partial [Legionellales bacterium]|nr:hypothetical protein [Legionellales bacterium]